MDLKQLRSFVYIADLRSISLAAAALRIAQPALTRQLHKLEEEIGAKLMNRHSRGVAPTPAGVAFLERARAILADVDDIKSTTMRRAEQISGTVSLGLPIPVTPILSSRLIMRVGEEYPSVSLRIVEGFSTLIHEWLSSGSVALALLYGGSSSRVVWGAPLVAEDLYVIGSSSERNRAVQSYAPMDLNKLPLVLPHEPHQICDALMRAGVNIQSSRRVDALGAMKDFAERDIGYTILPISAVFRDVEAGRLSAAPIRHPSVSQQIHLCSSSLRRLPAVADHLSRFIDREVRNVVAEGHWPGGAII